MFSRPMVRYLILLCFAVSASQNALASCAPWLKHDLKQLHSGKPLDVCAVTAGKPLLLVNVHKNDAWTTDGKAAADKRYSPWSMVLVNEYLPLLVVAHNLVLSKRGKLAAASVKVLSTFAGMHRTLTHYTTHGTTVD